MNDSVTLHACTLTHSLLLPAAATASLLLCSSLSFPCGSWGGGYNPADDSLKFKEAVTLNRRFVLLPKSWGCQLGHGPLLLTVVFRCVLKLMVLGTR